MGCDMAESPMSHSISVKSFFIENKLNLFSGRDVSRKTIPLLRTSRGIRGNFLIKITPKKNSKVEKGTVLTWFFRLNRLKIRKFNLVSHPQ